jgi:hypothetical protein
MLVSAHHITVYLHPSPVQAALDAMEAYYVKVKTEQRLLQERLDQVESLNQTLQQQLRALQQEHSTCANSK